MFCNDSDAISSKGNYEAEIKKAPLTSALIAYACDGDQANTSVLLCQRGQHQNLFLIKDRLRSSKRGCI